MAGKVETVWKPEHKSTKPEVAFRSYQESYCMELSGGKLTTECIQKVAKCGQVLNDALAYKHEGDTSSWSVSKPNKTKYMACAKEALAH